MSAESEVSSSKVSGTEVSKINVRFIYPLCRGVNGEVSEIKCLSVFIETLFRA